MEKFEIKVKKERPKGDDGYRTFSVRVKNETVETPLRKKAVTQETH